MEAADLAYREETQLVDDFVGCLEAESSPWGPVRVGREFFYQRGKTDIVAANEDGEVLAFEAKLVRWRDALHQAYRNTCFSHFSYIVLPMATALRAQKYHAEFERRGVGICYVADDELVILHQAPKLQPLLPWLCNRATSSLAR